jgi:hypothetical protein
VTKDSLVEKFYDNYLSLAPYTTTRFWSNGTLEEVSLNGVMDIKFPWQTIVVKGQPESFFLGEVIGINTWFLAVDTN